MATTRTQRPHVHQVVEHFLCLGDVINFCKYVHKPCQERRGCHFVLHMGNKWGGAVALELGWHITATGR